MLTKYSNKSRVLNWLNNLRNKLSTYLLIILIFAFGSSLVQSIRRTKAINREVEEKVREVEDLKREQERLKEELVRVQSEEYIEKQLRDNLGLSKEGEITVILPDPEFVKRFALKLEDEEDILPDPNWRRWLKLFL